MYGDISGHTSSSTKHMEAVTLADFLSRAGAGLLDGPHFGTRWPAIGYDMLKVYRAGVLATYELVYTILGKNGRMIRDIRFNPLVKNVVEKYRKVKAQQKSLQPEYTWDITEVIQFWQDFPSAKSLHLVLDKLPRPHRLVQTILRAKAVALFRFDTSTRSGDLVGACFELCRPQISNWSTANSVTFQFLNTKEVQLSNSTSIVSDPVRVYHVKRALSKCSSLLALQDYVSATAGPQISATGRSPIFTTMIKPYSALSSGRLANIFKMSLAACNIRALPHSARSASTSALLILGMPVNKIVKHARWAHTKTFVRHYKKDIARMSGLSDVNPAKFNNVAAALRCRVDTSGSDSQKAQRMFHNLKAWFDLPLVAMCNNTKSAAKLVDGAPATIGTQYGVTISHMNSIVRAEFPNANFTTRPEMARSTRL